MPTLVVNIRSGLPYDVYVGRGSKWGNPFSHRPSRFDTIHVATREEAVARHAEWIKTQPQLLAALPELRGKRLGCHCGEDQACHAQTLADLADVITLEEVAEALKKGADARRAAERLLKRSPRR
jgi:hypothetical protein